MRKLFTFKVLAALSVDGRSGRSRRPSSCLGWPFLGPNEPHPSFDEEPAAGRDLGRPPRCSSAPTGGSTSPSRTG